MIYKQDTLINIEGDSFGEVFQTKINKNKLSKLYGILSNLYRDIPGSIVREYSTNAWDSNTSAGKSGEPFFITLHKEEGNSYILFKDVGLGMSPKTVQDIYFNYLDSTKEDSNDVAGMFGLGSKSALAYTHTFYIDTIYNGILYHYIFSKQANGIPVGELLFDEPTEECNGTTVKIPIKDGDEILFARAIRDQIIYFPNVYINIPSNVNERYSYSSFDINNDFKLYEGNNYIYRPDTTDTSMHICLGNVYYQLNYKELGVNNINIPIALKFNIGELTPIPSREDIVYSRESIEIIKNKINDTIEELTNKYNKTVEKVSTLKEYILKRNEGSFINIPIDEKENLYLKVSTIYLPGVKKLTINNCCINPEVLLRHVYLDYKYCNSKISAQTGYKREVTKGFYNYDVKNFCKNKENVFILNNELSHIKNQYLSTIYSNDIYLIKPKTKSLNNYKATILKGVDKKDWRKTIKDFQKFSEEAIKEIHTIYDNVKINKTWLEKYEEQRKLTTDSNKQKRKELKQIVYYEPTSGSNKSFIWDKSEATIEYLTSLDGYTVYLDSKDKRFSLQLYELFYRTYKKYDLNVITTAKSYHKYFKDKKNMFTYDEFLNSKHRKLKRVATAYMAKNIVGNIPYYIEEKTYNFHFINEEYQEKASFLYDYIRKNDSSFNTIDIVKEIAEYLDDKNQLDYYIIDRALELKDILNKIKDIHNYFPLNNSYNRKYSFYKYLVALMKLEGLKVNKYWYLKNEYNPVWLKYNKNK